jgi:hypothetical protein
MRHRHRHRRQQQPASLRYDPSAAGSRHRLLLCGCRCLIRDRYRPPTLPHPYCAPLRHGPSLQSMRVCVSATRCQPKCRFEQHAITADAVAERFDLDTHINRDARMHACIHTRIQFYFTGGNVGCVRRSIVRAAASVGIRSSTANCVVGVPGSALYAVVSSLKGVNRLRA